MQVSVEQKSTLERAMTVTVPSVQVELEVEKRLKQTAKTARIAGFRPGKAPLSFIRKNYEQSARSAVFEELVNQTFSDAIKEQNFTLAGRPQIEAKVFEKDQDLEYVATFELFPEFELADFSQMEIKKITSQISDDDIDFMLDMLRKQSATYTQISRSAQNEDRLKIDFTGSIDGVEFEGGSAKNTYLVLGSKQFIPGFEEGLIGKNQGENVVLDVTFPENYGSKELAGKKAQFSVLIHEVSAPQLPELNTEFFAKFAVNVDNIADFRAEVAKNMQREMRKVIHNKMRTIVTDALLAANQIEIPKVMISHEINTLKHRMSDNFKQQGQTIDVHSLADDLFQEPAMRNVKASLLFAEVVKKFDLKPDEARVRGMVEEMSTMYQDSAQMVSYIYKNERMLGDVQSLALEEQTIETVVNGAQVTEENVSYQELTKQ